MAGYIIYSLDWDKFQSFVSKPTDKHLSGLAKRILDELENLDDDDSVHDWPGEPTKLRGLVKKRLAKRDWYGDLSDTGKEIWSQAIWGFCCHDRPAGVGFRADHDGIYWPLLDLAWKELKIAPNEISPDVALSAFGKRPFRYCLATIPDEGAAHWGGWYPMHSMHTPDEVRKMLHDLATVATAIAVSKNQQAIRDYDSLMRVLEKLDRQGRMLFVQVDT